MDEECVEGADGAFLEEAASLDIAVSHVRLFYGLALDGAREAAQAEGKGASVAHARGVLSALIYSAVTLEAYPSELMAALVRGQPRCEGVSPERLGLVCIEQSKTRPAPPVEVCYSRAALKPDDEAEAQWFKRVGCLRELRNAWVHFKLVTRPGGAWPERVDGLNCKDIVEGWLPGEGYDWTTQVLRAAVAEWACDTARLAIEALHSLVGGVHPWDTSLPPEVRFPERGPLV